MTDPAVAAAKRMWAERGAPDIEPSPSEIAAANEALRPIRELADRWHAATNLLDGQTNLVARAFADELRRVLGDSQ